jgi:hypothetical protein
VVCLVAFVGIASDSASSVVVLGFGRRWSSPGAGWRAMDLYRRTPLLTPAARPLKIR